MKKYETGKIRNVALVGHQGSGKTTLAECMLFEAGVIPRRGAVESKNTVSDHHPMEHERESSIYNSLLHLEWKDTKINLIDTPGFDDFIGEALGGLKVADTIAMCVNAQNGVQVGTGILWNYAAQMNKPIVLAVNLLDHENANWENTIESLQNAFGPKVTLMQYPVNPGSGFNQIIDVLRMTLYKFPADGGKPEKTDIPEEHKATAEKLHNDLVENIAAGDEKLMEVFFEKGTLSEDELRAGLKNALVNREIFPVFCMSSKQNMGSGRLMGFIANVCPAPSEVPAAMVNEKDTLPCDTGGDTCLFIWKTATEPSLGELSYFKVYSGEIKLGDDLTNCTTSNPERFNQLYLLNGKTRENAESLPAGDIGVTVKMKDSRTNHSLCPKGKKMVISPVSYPEPTIRAAITNKTKGAEDKLAIALKQIRNEDPSITVGYVPELKQTILATQGELQLNLFKQRLEEKKIEIEYTEPRIPYRETIQGKADAMYRHKKQTGGAGQFAEVHMRVEPWYENAPYPSDLKVRDTDLQDLPWGGKLEYVNCIVGGSIDARFMPAILKGVMEKMEEGPITGSCVRDVRVIVYDGKMHPVDSNDMAFKLAGRNAFKDAFLKARPILLEPIYEIDVLVPDDARSEVMGDLQTRRGIVQGMDVEGHLQKITAKIPLAELHNYASALRSISGGTGKHRQRFDVYQQVPGEIQQKLQARMQEAELEEA